MHADGGGLNNTYLDYERHLCPQFDWAFTALIEDLEQRGLLAETVVAVLSEFGRTPRVNGRGGRDHYPAAWTNFLCGGSIQGGQVIGSTDKIGSPTERLPRRAAANSGVDLSRHGHRSRHDHDAGPGRPAGSSDRGRADQEIVLVSGIGRMNHRDTETQRREDREEERDVPRATAFRSLLRLLSVLVSSLCLGASVVHAAEPSIRNLDIRGLQIGGSTALVVDGEELGTSPRLLLPFAAKQTLKPGASGKRAVFDVALDAAVQPGYHHLRIATAGGVSLPVVIGVDRLPQRPLAVSVDRLPVALHGVVSGSTVVSTLVFRQGRSEGPHRGGSPAIGEQVAAHRPPVRRQTPAACLDMGQACPFRRCATGRHASRRRPLYRLDS